ncbi:MAG: Holliday junction branch migration protein RuvA [Proteobacteria bacterium]|nr:Holliday junction branch migration protein RuvA [Pseudomonadota bacterium]
MIALLNGSLIDITNGEAIIDVNGVGYAVRIPATYFAKVGTHIKLFIDTVVREESITLYGFETSSERNCFKILYSVSGVGPKTALSIISFYSVDELRRIMVNRDIDALSRVPGIGKKTAERMVVELKDKMGISSGGVSPVAYVGEMSVHEELIQALVNFGYKRNDAINALKPRIDDINKGRPMEEILRETLRGMM